MLQRVLHRRADLRDEGWTERQLRHELSTGSLVRVRRGWYAEKVAWAALWPEQRQRELVEAVHRDGTSAASVVSHLSAAARWGLPFYRLDEARVHLTTPAPSRISSDPGVLRHVAVLADEDVTELHGIRCTSLERTVFDCSRMLRLEAGLSMADAALRQVATGGRRYDEAAAREWMAKLSDRAGRAAGARGVRRARQVNLLADGRAQLPGESVSRLQLMRLGFARPRLQVPVASPSGGWYWVDFGLDEARAFGEFDGKGKYTDEAQRSGLTIEEVMLDEKMREDWIRGRTQWRLGRWGDEHIATAPKLGARLAAFGILPPQR